MNKAGPENPHSQQKIEQAKKFIELELEPERAFKAAVVTESVAQGDYLIRLDWMLFQEIFFGRRMLVIF